MYAMKRLKSKGLCAVAGQETMDILAGKVMLAMILGIYWRCGSDL